MYTEQQELLQSQTYVEEPSINKEASSEQLVKREKLPGTPFHQVKDGKGYWLIMGKYLITPEPLESETALMEYIEINTWNIVLQLAVIALDFNNKIK